MHLDISQSSTCSSSRLTCRALFEVKLQFVKIPSPLFEMQTAPPCKQVDRTIQTHTHTHAHTHKQQSVHACMHSFIHSFIHSFNPPYSLYHSFTRTNQALPLQFITIYNHPSINHQPCIARTTQQGSRTCTHDVAMTRTQWNAIACAYRLPTTTLHRYIHTYMHACMHVQR